MPIPDRPDEHPAQAVARLMRGLGLGDLAQCRRMDHKTASPVFWRFAVQHPTTIGRIEWEKEWMEIVRVLAILTPKGDPANRPPLHDGTRKFGAVLCDGGDQNPEWSGRPMFSEFRLEKLMAARGSQRAVLLKRAAQMLVHSRESSSRVNVIDIAKVLLEPENGRLLAEPYYRRLDRAEQIAIQSEKGAT